MSAVGWPESSPLVTLTGITDQVAPPSRLLTGPRPVPARMVVAAGRFEAAARSRQAHRKRVMIDTFPLRNTLCQYIPPSPGSATAVVLRCPVFGEIGGATWLHR